MMQVFTSDRVRSENAQEKLAVLSFISKLINCGLNTPLNLNVCALKDALYSLLLNEQKQKIFVLYFHNQGTEFSEKFCDCLLDRHVEDMFINSFVLHGWDVGEDTYQEVLIDAMSEFLILEPCIAMVRQKQSAAIFISLVDMQFEIYSILKVMPSIKDFSYILQKFVNIVGNRTLKIDETHTEEADKYGYREFQQRMFDEMGNRDYDCFDAKELDSLKDKIAYALFGMPSVESGYGDKQVEERDKMYDVILKANNEYSEYENQVMISVVYNCLVPLEAKNSDQKYNPVPIFILRKCREAYDPCRIVIDHTRRVYASWNDYLENNKFCECLMIVLEDGRYAGDENGKVKLQQLESPACSIGKKALKATDIASTVLGLGSSGVFVAAAVPAITVAPIAIIGAAIVGTGVGAYCVGRSVFTLIDRGMHRQSLSVREAEARGAYINIAAGATGLVGAGTNIVVSQLAANGVTIGTTARVAVNTIGVATIGISGLALTNSAVDVFMQWWIDDEIPSALTVLQLSTSILFFGHAVYNFKTAGTIIEESQTKVLKDYNDSLRSNRHRKVFNKLKLETMRLNNGDLQRGRAEVISTLIRIKNKDEVFGFLARNNRQLNEMGIRFAARDGRITFNGIPVNLSEVVTVSRSDIFSFFNDLPSRVDTSNDFNMTNINFDFTGFLSVDNLLAIRSFVNQLIGCKSLSGKICCIWNDMCKYFRLREGNGSHIDRVLNDLFPDGARYLEYLRILLSFIRKLVQEYQNSYDMNDNNFLFKYLGDMNANERKLFFMQNACDELLCMFRSPEKSVEKLIIFIEQWIVNVFMEREEKDPQREPVERGNRRRVEVKCKICSGRYFK